MATRIVILGGGFGGANVARHLERLLPKGAAEVTLISRDNYFLMTPLLFEAGSGALELRHVVNPIRPLLGKARFVNASVEKVDIANHTVHARSNAGDSYEIGFDHLVIALGQISDKTRIHGSEHAMAFKTLMDALKFRNHVIEIFERADAEPDPASRIKDLTFAIVGGGLVGTELVGELTEFIRRLLQSYRRIQAQEIKIVLLQHGARILPELDEKLASYATGQFAGRGVQVRVNTGVEKIEPGCVYLPGGETIQASTIVMAAGLSANPIVTGLGLKAERGRIVTDGCMRVAENPGIWALGDCAAIPGADGKPYPTLAQHALREAKQLAKNLVAVISNKEPHPFLFKTLGTMAALGRYRGVATVFGIKIRGFIAWWMWRTYYLMQMANFERKTRVAIDWTFDLVFTPDAVKIDMEK